MQPSSDVLSCRLLACYIWYRSRFANHYRTANRFRKPLTLIYQGLSMTSSMQPSNLSVKLRKSTDKYPQARDFSIMVLSSTLKLDGCLLNVVGRQNLSSRRWVWCLLLGRHLEMYATAHNETPRDHKHFLKNVFEFSGCSTVCRDIRFEDVCQAERHYTHRCKEDWYLPWGMCPILCSQRRSHGGIRVWTVLWLVCCDVLLHPMHRTSMRLLQSDCYSWWPKHKGASYK